MKFLTAKLLFLNRREHCCTNLADMSMRPKLNSELRWRGELQSALFCRERRIGREPEMTEGVAFVSGISPHSPGGWESAHLAGDPTLAPNQKRGLGRLGAKTLLQHVQQIVVG